VWGTRGVAGEGKIRRGGEKTWGVWGKGCDMGERPTLIPMLRTQGVLNEQLHSDSIIKYIIIIDCKNMMILQG
jgi:hypothetical protein